MFGYQAKPGIYCKRCKGDLRGVYEGICPRCGLSFDPEDAGSYRDLPYSRVWVTVLMVGVFVAGGMVAALLFMPGQDGYFQGFLLNLIFGGVVGLVLSPVGFFVLAMSEWYGEGVEEGGRKEEAEDEVE